LARLSLVFLPGALAARTSAFRSAFLDGNFAAALLLLWHRDRDLEHSVLEFGARLVDVRAVRQRHDPVEAAVAALGPVHAFAAFFVFLFPLPPDHQAFIRGLDLYIVFVQARQFGANGQVIALLAYFDRRRP
jgi:hypothetical protein